MTIVTVAPGSNIHSQNIANTKTPQQQNAPTRLIASFIGDDSSNVVHQILSVVSLPGVVLIDLRQTVVQKRLALVIELEISTNSTNSRNEAILYKNILSIASQLSLHVDCEFLPTQSPTKPTVQEQQPSKLIRNNSNNSNNNSILNLSSLTLSVKTPTQYAITLLSPSLIPPESISEIAIKLNEYHLIIQSIKTLSSYNLRCIELIIGPNNSKVNNSDMNSSNNKITLTQSIILNLRKDLFFLGKSYELDTALQSESISRKSKRLVVFDMDSTIIQQEVIDELAKYANVYEKVKEITDLAMNGIINFEQSLKQRCLLLKNSSSTIYSKVINNLKYTSGIKSLCKTLKKLG